MGWLGMGSYVARFEEELQDLVAGPDRHVVAVSTGHAALHLALLLAGVGKGDEVITPAFNNIADFQAILATGATPVLCDMYDETLCIDPERANDLMSARTRAIIVMDYACSLCAHDELAELAERHGLRLVHDAAHSFGSSYRGRPVGGFSDMTMFSFDPVKTITSIDGGALVVRSEDERDRLREMRLMGMGQPSALMYRDERAWTYDVTRLGFRYHMANLHAAIGLAQLSKLEAIASSRREACRFFDAELGGISGLRGPPGEYGDVIPFLYYVRVDAEERDRFRAHLAEHGVDTGLHWQPAHWFSLFRDCPRGPLPVTDRVGREIVSLPLHSCMAEEARDRVVDGVRTFFG
jgi:dTDP-4-amino-4,6-dideoxygalactose transaminase